MAGWTPRKTKWDWRSFLTEDEASEAVSYERKIETARYEMALAAPPLQRIRNRAIQRAKQAANTALANQEPPE